MYFEELIKKVLRYGSILAKSPKQENNGGGDTQSARYCYSVWLRHLVTVHKNGFTIQPGTVVELGPGRSLGTGLTALLSGANEYYALDVIRYSTIGINLKILDELIGLFMKREDIPGEAEFPKIKPRLNSYKFPHNILTDDRIKKALDLSRIKAIKTAIRKSENSSATGKIRIFYIVPWDNHRVIKPGIVDMLYSQAVLQYVKNIGELYSCLHTWLKPGGIMSHEIDFSSLGTSSDWNGHWTYSDYDWELISGRQRHSINRYAYSAYVKMTRDCGFEIVAEIKSKYESRIKRESLAPKFRNLSEDDLTTSSAYILSVKR